MAARSGGVAARNAIDFPIDALHGRASGNLGILRKTIDGQTWSSEDSGVSVTLRDIQFPVDETTGFAVGDDGTIIRRLVE